MVLFHRPKHDVAVVIPIYRTELSEYEVISLRQCLHVLGRYPIIVMAPEGLNIEKIGVLEGAAYRIQSFPEGCFADLDSYSRLMHNMAFYEKFVDYKYILLYQLDAFVFSDQLRYWCSLSYDYIGAPWLGVPWVHEFTETGPKFFRNFLPRKEDRIVGNGGFSLRRIRSFLLALAMLKDKAEQWTNYEDVFWSFEVPNWLPFFRIPGTKTALRFSFENEPAGCFSRNNNELPFGCHAWEKFDIEFWRPIFGKYGYRI